MTVPIRVAARAAAQIEQAAAWWLENRRAAPQLFEEELARAYGTLRTLPEPVSSLRGHIAAVSVVSHLAASAITSTTCTRNACWRWSRSGIRPEEQGPICSGAAELAAGGVDR